MYNKNATISSTIPRLLASVTEIDEVFDLNEKLLSQLNVYPCLTSNDNIVNVYACTVT